jgi:folate-dependent phosphoribosylglycinamide formyltransferase PurN
MRPIVLLAVAGPSTTAVYHALVQRFGTVHLILEDRVPRRQLLWRRVRRLGPITVLGQLLFMGLVLPVLRRRSAARLREIRAAAGFSDAPVPQAHTTCVRSVNSAEVRELLRRLQPTVVVVNGTRIIGTETLESVAAPFINMHAGITPAYRGVHGGYWALNEGRPDLVGTTIHLVDTGIDTGDILGQATFEVGPEDSFVTYPYLHTAAGLPLLIRTIEEALDGHISAVPAPAGLTSRLRTHPTFWQYLHARLVRGVR